LNTLFIGKNFVDLPAVDSTNTFAAELLESRPAEGTVVFAQHQTAGRGQQGSEWHVEPGQNLTFSIILYPHFLAVRDVFLLNKMIAWALRNAVQALLPGQEVLVKWPNDLLVGRKKISGILIETNLEKNSIRSVIVGIGLNVNQVDFDPQRHGAATSLASVAGHSFEPMGVLELLLQHIEAGYLALRAGRHELIERDYLKHLYGYQEDTLAEIGGVQRMIHIAGVDGDGRLAVQVSGKLYFYGVKEIRFVI
jgi:BirA family transcriptional regulator, biotin operon repressor / biotin---[acetyl-CoA-carboxylase] ligase